MAQAYLILKGLVRRCREMCFFGRSYLGCLGLFFCFISAYAQNEEVSSSTQTIVSKRLQFSIDEKLEGPESVYTPILVDMIKNWPPDGLGERRNPGSRLVHLECIETDGNSNFIGLLQQMVIESPLSRVEVILDDINHYQDLFPGYDDIHIVSKLGNRWVTFWEQHIPLFFVPNVKYQLTYLIDKDSADRKIYRYQLNKSSHLKTSDGIIVIERERDPKTSKERTRYTEFDFFDAEWGLLKTVAPGRIWKESVEGIFLSDLSIKLKAESPEWSYKKIAEESRKALELNSVTPCIEGRKKLFSLVKIEKSR